MMPLNKPRYGMPCNGCGACCRSSLCRVGEMTHGFLDGPCPSLVESPDGSSFCALIAAEVEGSLKPELQLALGVGLGCTMVDDEDSEEFGMEVYERNRALTGLRRRCIRRGEPVRPPFPEKQIA